MLGCHCGVILWVVRLAKLFVCFAQDPAAMQAAHPAEFSELLGAWRVGYPQAMEQAGPEYSHVTALASIHTAPEATV